MNTAIILYMISILITIIIFSSYAIIKKTKNKLQETADETIQKMQQQHLVLIENLEKKLDQYYTSCKLDKLCFIGIGGGGCNIIEGISSIDPWHTFIHINSDLQALRTKNSQNKILLGYDKKKGLGCGGISECGMKLVDNINKKQLYKLSTSFQELYIVASLGGGVGSGATAEIVEYLNTLDKEVFVFVTMPFSFEGKTRNSIAQKALKNIQAVNNNITILNNDDLLKHNNSKSLGIKEAFQISSKIIYKKILKSVYN